MLPQYLRQYVALPGSGRGPRELVVMSQQTLCSEFHAGYALAVVNQLTNAERIREDAFLAALLVRCWIDPGQFRHAGEIARELAESSLIHKDGQFVIAVYGQLATVLDSPAPTHRNRLRQLSINLQGSEDPHCRGGG